MDIAQQRLEIADVVHRLTSESVLEQMTVALILLVEMVCVRYGDTLGQGTVLCPTQIIAETAK